ncbi:MAG: VanZ family protein [Mogibacterium sp.]|nr:VanZ family protein [Mogibacterium sp.]MBR0340838.1 VanZ family protein [Oscillospiraceae bacterium]
MKRSDNGAKFDTARIHLLITLAVLIFIFVHSAMSSETSGGESGFFAGILSLITGLRFQTAHFIVRKAAHFSEFAVLGICLNANFIDLTTQNEPTETTEPNRSPAKQMLWKHHLLATWIAGTLYAGTDEFHQFFVEGRSCEFRDVCIDAAGVAFGILITVIVRAIKAGGSIGRRER